MRAPKAPELMAIGSTITNINKVQILTVADKPIVGITIYENDRLLATLPVESATSFIAVVSLTASPGQKIIRTKVIDSVGNESPLSSTGLVYNLQPKVLESLGARITVPVGALEVDAGAEVNTNPKLPVAGIPVPKVDNSTGKNIAKVNFIKAVQVDLTQPAGSTELGKVAINTHLDITLEATEKFADPGKVRILYYDPLSNEWSATGITVLAVADNQVSFRTTHLTLFAIAEVELTAIIPPSILSVKLGDIAVVTGDYVNVRPTVNIVATDDNSIVAYRLEVLDENCVPIVGNDTDVVSLNTLASANVAINALPQQSLGSGSYYIRISIIDNSGSVSTQNTPLIRAVATTEALVLSEVMSAPNPFNPRLITNAHIGYQLSKTATVKLYIHSLNGSLIYSASQQSNAGYGEFLWSGIDNLGSTVANGGYIAYVIAEAGNQRITKVVKIAVLR